MRNQLLLVFCLLFSVSRAQTILSPQAEISIITCGPYQGELYSAFGHSAIRVIDPVRGFDIAFNYGVFDFNQPNFYLNFTRGYLYYKLGVYSYPDFRDHYISYNRYVHEQVLALDSAQKQKVFSYLENNSLPENQTYRYDYFYNNCASKVRDVFVEVFKEEIKFDSTFIKTDYTIRDLTEIYLKQQPWGDLGIDICLGLPMDKKASSYDYMFLPDYIESSFDRVALNGSPIVGEKISVYESSPETIPFHWYHPWIVFGLLLLVAGILSYRDWQRQKLSKWFDVTLFGAVGIVGLLLFILWLATDHKAAANNFNIAWAFPLHLVGAIGLLKRTSPKWISGYFIFAAIISAILLGFWTLLPQTLNPFLLPVIFIMLMRSLVIIKVQKG
ncbi:MAG: DUF4105 domain-containing protein [Cytophagales bacterium]|jgi:hypothetical protein|nr:DUF4105 domain-containing protein [Cytophagales bacterium]MCA6387006.1 DUF4105 domain-containing protein [Cytophagales bacterium]MCA6390096.1 DUF4105 domain-containing protein [Cytophagales bacterium]MCA6394812.1 DUF4105 domain-containing protein [Cytophagales bacterium]MCA6399421.1 DUF4105 domain-containing protein [Cytophagales bacterium]